MFQNLLSLEVTSKKDLENTLWWHKRYDKMTKWSWIRNDRWVMLTGVLFLVPTFAFSILHGLIEKKDVLTLSYYQNYFSLYQNETVIYFILILSFSASINFALAMISRLFLKKIPSSYETILTSKANRNDPYAAFILYEQAKKRGSEFWKNNWLEVAFKNNHYEAKRILQNIH